LSGEYIFCPQQFHTHIPLLYRQQRHLVRGTHILPTTVPHRHSHIPLLYRL
jgi:hypothetical protein